MNLKRFTLSISVVTALVMCSYYFLDVRIALFASRVIHINPRLATYASNIPDLLSVMVSTITIGSWMVYTTLSIRGAHSEKKRQFSQLICVTIPVSFFLKSILQNMFGRFNPRAFLLNPRLSGFHWFGASGDYGSCFPSGHMTVISALLAGLWHFYPRYRYGYIALALTLAVLLILTNYHFLSDVILGAYLGIIIEHLTYAGVMSNSAVK